MPYRPPPANSPKPPRPMGGHPQPHLNLAPPKPKPAPKAKPQHATAQIQHHVDHFAEAPARHAKALKRLGVNQQTIHHIAQESRGTNPRVAGGRAPVRQSSGFANIHNFTGNKLVDRTLGDLAQAGLYAIPGTAMAVAHPIRAAKTTYHQFGQDIHHPLRHPGYTALDVAAALGGVGGATARVGATGRALAAGEGLGRAVTRKGAEGGSVFHAPEPGTVGLKAGEHTVEKDLSRNAAYRQAQKAYYKGTNRQLERPVPKGRAQNEFGRTLRTTRRVENDQLKGDIHLVDRLSKHLSRGEHTALRVVAIEGNKALRGGAAAAIQRHIATHLQHIASGADKAAHQSVIRDLKQAQHVLANPSKRFQDALDATRNLANHGEQESIARGLLTKEGAEKRKAAMYAEYAANSEDVVRTRGVPLAERQAGVTSAYTLDREARQAETVLRGEQRKLDALERQMAKQPKGRPAAAPRSAEAVDAEIKALKADPKSWDYSHGRPDLTKAAARKLTDLSYERTHPKGAVTAKAGKARHRPVLAERIKEQKRVVETWQAEVQKTHARRTAEGPKIEPLKSPEGSFYFHAGRPQERGTLGRMFNKQPGTVTVPQTGRFAPELTHAFQGKNIRRGYVVPNVPKAVIRAYGHRLTLHSAMDLYDTLAKTGSKVRHSTDQFPVLVSKEGRAELQRYGQKLEENLHYSKAELGRMTADERVRAEQEHQVSGRVEGTEVGGSVPGVVWVHKKFLKDLGGFSSHGLLKPVDLINNVLRAGTLYLRPAYALNYLGNLGMLAPEGHLGPRAMWEAMHHQKLFGAEHTAFTDAAMSSGRAIGQTAPQGPLNKTIHGLANFWNHATDIHARRAAMRIEERRGGFNTPQQLRELRTSADPKMVSKRNEITRRARSIIGDYENLTPIEKNAVRRLIYFYPWLKVATKWTGHTVTEHPVKTAIMAEQGRVEAEHVKRVLGLLPQWARLTGLIPVGKKAGGMVDTINPSSVNTPSTVVQSVAEGANTARGFIGIKQHGTAGLQDAATPFAQAVLTGGSPSGSGTQRTGLLGAVQGTPEYAFAKRMGVVGKPSKTYPATGLKAAVGPMVAGGFAPRPTSVTQLNKSGAKELRAAMSPQDRVSMDYKKSYADLRAVYKSHGASDISPELRGRLALRHERAAARVKAAGGSKIDTKTAYASDIGLLVQHKWLTPKEAKATVAWSKNARKDDVSVALRYLTRVYFDRDHELSKSYKWFRDNGHPDLKQPTLP